MSAKKATKNTQKQAAHGGCSASPCWPLERREGETHREHWKRDDAARPQWIVELTTRLQNVLRITGIAAKDTARQAIESGQLKPGRTRNYGKKSDEELRKAVGLPVRGAGRCPKCGHII